MPTGYTADVADGKVTDFRTFALRCARAFGATIMQRDDPSDDPPKHRERSDFYDKHLVEARARLARLEAMTVEAADIEAQGEYQQALAHRKERIAENTERRNRYNAMLAEVVEWIPPTSEHVALKTFMIDQLTDSRKFDDFEPPVPKRRLASQWLREEIAQTRANIARYIDEAAKEDERVGNANAWIDALYDSLPSTEAVPS